MRLSNFNFMFRAIHKKELKESQNVTLTILQTFLPCIYTIGIYIDVQLLNLTKMFETIKKCKNNKFLLLFFAKALTLFIKISVA